MAFTPENDLEAALMQAVKKPALADSFYRLFLASDVLVMGTVNGPQKDAAQFTADAGSQFQLVTLQKDGERFLPIFTSLPRMQLYARKETPYIAMKARALLELTRGAHARLNPGSEVGGEFNPRQVAIILQILPLAPAQTRYDHVPLPEPLTSALCTVFDRRGDVDTAWMIRIDSANGPQLVLGVETAAAMPDLLADIQAAARDHAPDQDFDVQRVDRANPAAFSQTMLKAPPFYPRATRPN